MNTRINNHIDAFELLKSRVPEIQEMQDKVKICLAAGNKILVAGNGGSAATASHLVGEIVGKFMKSSRPGMPAIDLSGNNTVLTAVGNDFSFEEVFSRQVLALGKPGDLFIGFTTSGNSKNIIEASKVANNKGLEVLIISGKDGGRLSSECDSFIAPGIDTPTIQIIHDFLMHELAYAVDELC